MRSDEIIKVLERNLRFYSTGFFDEDVITRDINEEIKRHISADCYYYVAEEPFIENEIEIENYGIRMIVERAHDDVRCSNESIAYIKMRRAVVELPSGHQFWLVMSYEITPGETQVKLL